MKFRSKKIDVSNISYNAIAKLICDHTGTTIFERLAPDYDIAPHKKIINRVYNLEHFPNIYEQEGYNLDYIKSLQLYKAIEKTYKNSIRAEYWSEKGCATEFMKRYKISAEEFDFRTVLAFTCMTAVGTSLSLMAYAADDSIGDYLHTIQSVLQGYTTRKNPFTHSGTPWNLYYYYNTWMHNLTVACYIPIAFSLRGSDDNTEDRYYMLNDILSDLYAMAFINVDDLVFVTNTFIYYVNKLSLRAKSADFSVAFVDAIALMQPVEHLNEVSPRVFDDKSFEEYAASYKEVCEYPYRVLASLPNLPKNLNKVMKFYAKLFSPRTDLTVVMHYAVPIMKHSVVHLYNAYWNENSQTMAWLDALAPILVEHREDTGYKFEEFKADYDAAIAEHNLDRSKMFMLTKEQAFNYLRWACTAGYLKLLINDSRSFWGITCFSRAKYYLSRLSEVVDKKAAMEETVKKAENDSKLAEQYRRNYEKTQQKLDEARNRINLITQENNDLKRQISSHVNTSTLKQQINSLESQLQNERAVSAKLRNRVQNLEAVCNNRNAADSQILELQKALAAERHFNELIMNEPMEDKVSLTPMELAELRTIKAHLVVPDMNSFKELRKLMPKSVFLFNPNDRNFRMTISTGCDIFFFCTKFCNHGDWWQWLTKLSNVPERCIYAHTAGKNNVARLILAKHHELLQYAT